MSLKDYLDDRRKARERELRLETRKRQMKSAKNIAVGTILGSLAGVTAGILFAQKSGEETRKDIADFADDATVQAKQNIDTAIENLKEKSDEISHDLKDKYQEYQDRNMTELHKVADEFDEAKDYIIDYIQDAENDESIAKDLKDKEVTDEDLEKTRESLSNVADRIDKEIKGKDLKETREELSKVADNIGKEDKKNNKNNKNDKKDKE